MSDSEEPPDSNGRSGDSSGGYKASVVYFVWEYMGRKMSDFSARRSLKRELKVHRRIYENKSHQKSSLED